MEPIEELPSQREDVAKEEEEEEEGQSRGSKGYSPVLLPVVSDASPQSTNSNAKDGVEIEQHNVDDKQRRRSSLSDYTGEQSHGAKGYAPPPYRFKAGSVSSQIRGSKANDGVKMEQHNEDDKQRRKSPQRNYAGEQSHAARRYTSNKMEHQDEEDTQRIRNPQSQYSNIFSPLSEYTRSFQAESTLYSDCEEDDHSASASASSEPSSRSDFNTGASTYESMPSSLPERRGFAQKTKFRMYGNSSSYGQSSMGQLPKNTMKAAKPESSEFNTASKAAAYSHNDFSGGTSKPAKQNRAPPYTYQQPLDDSASASINMSKISGYGVPRSEHFHEERNSPKRVDASSYGESISSNLYERLKANFNISKSARERKLSQTALLKEENPPRQTATNAAASYANSTNDAYAGRREPYPFYTKPDSRYSPPTRPPPDIMAKCEQDSPYSPQQQSPPYDMGKLEHEGRTQFAANLGRPPYVVGQHTDGEKHDMSDGGMSTADNEPYHTGGEYFATSESGPLSDRDTQQQHIPLRNPSIFVNINGDAQSSLGDHEETDYGSGFETGSTYQDVKFNGDQDVTGPNMNQDVSGQLSPTQLKSDSKAFPDKYYKADTNMIKKIEKMLRVGCAVSSLIAFAVMISTSEMKVAAGSTFHVKFSDFQAYNYLVSINLLSFIYSVAQLTIVGHQKANVLSSPVKRGACLYVCDQILAFLLISSSSSAATASELSRSGLHNIWPPACSTWKLWLFCSKVDGAVIMSFFSVIFVIGSSFASGYRFSKLLAE